MNPVSWFFVSRPKPWRSELAFLETPKEFVDSVHREGFHYGFHGGGMDSPPSEVSASNGSP
jgi:hypothetical protein